VFVGTPRGLEATVLPRLGWPVHMIAVRGMRRQLTPANVAVPFRAMLSVAQSLVLLRRLRPAVVVGTGGYVSGPVVVAAWLLRVPRVIQEQNVRPGVTTLLLARLAHQVHVSYEESVAFFPRREKVHVSGNPVRRRPPELSQIEARRRFGLSPELPTLLVFGGSQGARRINEAMMGALPALMMRPQLQMIWGTGQADFDRVREVAARFGERVLVRAYIDDMYTAYRASDVAVCRAGAITLAELALFGLPALLVPYPFAAGQHQEWNARTLAQRGAARVLLDEETTAERLIVELTPLLEDQEGLKRMGMRMAELARPEAAARIVAAILALAARSDTHAGPHG
ncbi:MAG: undecaprenyldiphospho-muramoylpentapeptide beta-N-acetylglucosaminyltransferase, partial [candidate division KSB1 bacterium]|nr:undecaprenyldiphospho-muramoylpentapeptide beta-N-acetylglucosaminyltransferase [candidate division KSB1 bacterium]